MMLQDIAPHKLKNPYDTSAVAAAEDFVLAFDGARVLIGENLSQAPVPKAETAKAETGENEICFPQVKDLKEEDRKHLIYLFTVDEERYFLLPQVKEIKGFALRELKEIRERESKPKYRVFAAYTGKHLADWYRDNRFCGRCGKPMEHSKTERAMVCPDCGYTSYPRIMPAVIVGVRNGDRLLITRYRNGYNHNALIAGFTEIGETMEETVAREVMEEAGIRVKNITYYKSQPWGIANDILAGYYCDVDGDDTIHMDSDELKYAEWVRREDIVLQPDHSSLTNEMMERFRQM